MAWSLSRFNPASAEVRYKNRLHALRMVLGVPIVIAMILGMMACGSAISALAATNVSGVVTDSITGQALAGVRVTLSSGQTPLSVINTETDGVFQMFVNLPVNPAPQTYILEVLHPGYGTHHGKVVVTSGRADQLSYKVALPRNEAIGCVPDPGRSVVIGHVREPASATHDLDLSERVKSVLEYDLLTEIQKTHLPSAQQPSVFSCPNALPKSMKEQAVWARALKADAFVVGEAASDKGKFKVNMQVSARYAEPGSLPVLASTPDMDLDRPASADIGHAALEPIMIALLRAYLKEERYTECVEFSMAAESALGKSVVLNELRKSCQIKLPNRGLLMGGEQ